MPGKSAEDSHCESEKRVRYIVMCWVQWHGGVEGVKYQRRQVSTDMKCLWAFLNTFHVPLPRSFRRLSGSPLRRSAIPYERKIIEVPLNEIEQRAEKSGPEKAERKKKERIIAMSFFIASHRPSHMQFRSPAHKRILIRSPKAHSCINSTGVYK